MRGEFAFIERLRAALGPLPEGWVGPGDDCAVLDDGLLLAVDTLVDGVHFDQAWTAPDDIGWKAMAVNVSDLAAMGGEPVAAVAAVTLSGVTGLADGIGAGLSEAAGALGCPLVGGDLTSGPTLVISVAVLGRATRPVLRSGARPGDVLVVTGTLGGPAAALASGDPTGHPGGARLVRPEPRVGAGRAAADAGAWAMIDISDGLGSEVHHICRESGVGARIDASALPLAPRATLDHALDGGDDYELLFAIADPAAVVGAGVELTVIGEITDAPDVLLDIDGTTRPLPDRGYSHDPT